MTSRFDHVLVLHSPIRQPSLSDLSIGSAVNRLAGSLELSRFDSERYVGCAEIYFVVRDGLCVGERMVDKVSSDDAFPCRSVRSSRVLDLTSFYQIY